MKRIGIGLIKLYRIVFAWLPSSCRFEPTCSHYTEQAIEKYGLCVAAGWAPSGSRAVIRGIRAGMTQFASEAPRVTLRPRRSWIGPVLLIAAIAILVAACAPGGGGVDASGNPIPPSPQPPLEPAQPGADPISLLAWLFTPIFTFLFIILAAAYNLFWGLGFPAPSAGRSSC